MEAPSMWFGAAEPDDASAVDDPEIAVVELPRAQRSTAATNARTKDARQVRMIDPSLKTLANGIGIVAQRGELFLGGDCRT
jgi:hypothetical protein